jgi:hypothetical protein
MKLEGPKISVTDTVFVISLSSLAQPVVGLFTPIFFSAIGMVISKEKGASS